MKSWLFLMSEINTRINWQKKTTLSCYWLVSSALGKVCSSFLAFLHLGKGVESISQAGAFLGKMVTTSNLVIMKWWSVEGIYSWTCYLNYWNGGNGEVQLTICKQKILHEYLTGNEAHSPLWMVIQCCTPQPTGSLYIFSCNTRENCILHIQGALSGLLYFILIWYTWNVESY